MFSQIDAKQKFYKWTDADGNTHYSEKKPEDKQVDEIKVYAGSSSNQNLGSKNDKTASDEEKSAEEQAIDEYNASEQARIDKLQAKENCKVAKKNLETLQNSARVKQKDPETGKLSYMNNDKRKDMLELAKKTIKKDCK